MMCDSHLLEMCVLEAFPPKTKEHLLQHVDDLPVRLKEAALRVFSGVWMDRCGQLIYLPNLGPEVLSFSARFGSFARDDTSMNQIAKMGCTVEQLQKLTRHMSIYRSYTPKKHIESCRHGPFGD